MKGGFLFAEEEKEEEPVKEVAKAKASGDVHSV